jgi:hypothetical protein
MADNIHLVLITSVIKVRQLSVYDEETRFQQTIDSIRSIQKHVPQYYIVLIEGSRDGLTSERKEQLLQLGNNIDIIYCDITHLSKQHGEVQLIHGFLESPTFSRLKETYNILTFNKLSGRYYLHDDFTFHYDNETCVCAVVYPPKSCTGYACIQTRFYSIPFKYIDHYKERLIQCFNHLFHDIEHSFYRYGVIPLHKINSAITKINVCGNIAPDGSFVHD